MGEPTQDLEALPYGGARYPVDALLDNRLFVRFPIDVVASTLFMEPVDQVEGEDWLGFAGIKKGVFKLISKEQQFAEKLHAYSLPREDSENSRVKDLVDLSLLVEMGNLKKALVQKAIREVFEYRDTHPTPDGLTEPPGDWGPKFDRLAKETRLPLSLDEALVKIAKFLNLPIKKRM